MPGSITNFFTSRRPLQLSGAILSLIIFTPFAWSANWVEISSGDGPNGYTTLIDTKSFVAEGDYREIWVMWTSPNEQVAERTQAGLCMSSKQLFVVHCGKRLWNIKYRTCHTKENGEGKSITTIENMDAKATKPLVPGSVAENIASVACAPVETVKVK
jgi:hypothetical protein